MNDALGQPQSVLVLGATSEIARAVVDRLVEGRARRVVLAARDEAGLGELAEGLRSKGVAVETTTFDASDPASTVAAVDTAFRSGDVDMALIAFGVLGDQLVDEHDPAAITRVVTVNFTAAAAAGVALADRMRAQGHGAIVVLSSVAGERPRRANFVYGSSKAGLDAFFQGLRDSLVGSGVQVTVVRPGFVHTRMTHGMKPAPLSTTPDAVAADVIAGAARGAHTVWSPGPLRFFMSALRHLPRGVFRRIPG
ncbi:MAG TPA: decaprenylphospho-beta-D-erythro-pentofuranosid-2-ulose 2-reductase [Acidimicrobiales bacterium]|nr:decaprenylphospho-beta-D-erythro-pentofuranosid-2-ulose 2-reductase [Acidimicrobiales bacterium]